MQALDVVGEITGLETFGGTVGLAAGAISRNSSSASTSSTSSTGSRSSSSSRGQQPGPAAGASSSGQQQGPGAEVSASGAEGAGTPVAGSETGTAAAAAAAEAAAAGSSSSGQQRIQQLLMVLDEGAMAPRADRNSPRYCRFLHVMSFGHLEAALFKVTMGLLSGMGNEDFLRALNFLTPGSIAYMENAKSWVKAYEHILIVQHEAHARAITLEYLIAEESKFTSDVERLDARRLYDYIIARGADDASYASFAFLHVTHVLPALQLIRKSTRVENIEMVLAGIKVFFTAVCCPGDVQLRSMGGGVLIRVAAEGTPNAATVPL
jgi:hypothetical protein